MAALIVSCAVSHILGFRTFKRFEWLPQMATADERQNRGLWSFVVVLVIDARTHGGSEESEWEILPF